MPLTRSHAPHPCRRVASALLGASLLAGCGDDAALSAVTAPAPPPEKMAGMVKTHANVLARVTCAGCPETWQVMPCDFVEQVLREPGSLDVVRCTIVQPVVGVPGLPERLPAALLETAEQATRALAADGRHANIDGALRTYALGGDMQRLGELELWEEGLRLRAKAVAWLAEARPDATWPARLLALEAAAPAPARVTDAATLDVYNGKRDPGWAERSGIARASKLCGEAVRRPLLEQQGTVQQVGEALAPASSDGEALPGKLVDLWKASSLVRSHSIKVALTAALASERRCPASLDALVPQRIPKVPDGWSLDAGSCTPVPPAAPPEQPTGPPAAGALAAQP